MMEHPTNLLTRAACQSPWVVAPPVIPSWILYGFRKASAGPYRYSTRRNVVYARTLERQLGLDLYVPLGAGEKPPGVLLIHGGGWEIGSKSLHRGLGRLLATHGFLAAALDYRLLRMAPWPACLDDCRAALKWLRAQASTIGLDPARLALLGDSAGAHLAAMLAIETAGTDDEVRGVVAYFGPFDLTHPAVGRWPRNCQEHLLGGMLTDPAVMARAETISPIRLVTKDLPPFLLIHGEIDVIVPPVSSTWMAEALTEAGVRAEVIMVKGADHGLFSLGRIRPNLTEIDRAVAEFLKHNTAAS